MLDFKVNIVQVVNIAAILNGLIFCFLLLGKKENKRANRFLALLLIALSFTVITSLILEFRLYDDYPLLHLFLGLLIILAISNECRTASIYSCNFAPGPRHLFCVCRTAHGPAAHESTHPHRWNRRSGRCRRMQL